MRIIDTREAAEQFARDYNWEDTSLVEDPDFAAAEIISTLGEDVASGMRSTLRACLIASADRWNERAANRARWAMRRKRKSPPT